MAYRGDCNAVGRGSPSIRTAPFVGPWRRRIAVASPSAAWRCASPRRRGNRTHAIKNKAPWNCSDQMDSIQSRWGASVHVHSYRHRAASPGLIDLAGLDGGVKATRVLGLLCRHLTPRTPTRRRRCPACAVPAYARRGRNQAGDTYSRSLSSVTPTSNKILGSAAIAKRQSIGTKASPRKNGGNKNVIVATKSTSKRDGKNANRSKIIVRHIAYPTRRNRYSAGPGYHI